MRGKFGSTTRLFLVSLLVLGVGALTSVAHAVPPVLTIYGLVVNEENASCGVKVEPGDQVCISYSSNQNANVSVTVRRGDGPESVVENTSVAANVVTRSCVSAGDADGIVRTLRVQIDGEDGSDAGTCTYVVGSPPSDPAPTLSILGLRVNGASRACGTTVMSGDRVCMLFRSDQSGYATLSVQKGATTTIVARGTITAGVTYNSCVMAGAADNVTRTFNLTVSNSNGTDSETCNYRVAGVSPTPPSVTIVGLRVNGAYVGCGADVSPGDQVCVRFNSNQNANASVSVQKGATTTFVASGSVTAGINYVTCVTAGVGDHVTRLFGVRVSNANGSDTETCAYTVSP